MSNNMIGKTVSYSRLGSNGDSSKVITDVIAERRGSNYYSKSGCLIAKMGCKGLEYPRLLSCYYTANTGAMLHKSYKPELVIS